MRLTRSIGTSFLTAALTLTAIATAAWPALAGSGIEVTMHQARIIKLARPADTIIIGNPMIADASVQDAHTIVLTGKGFGVTNMVVMDSDGNPIVDEQVTVIRQTAQSLRIYRRADVQTLSCTPYCEGSYKNEAELASDAQVGGSQ
jgi:Flp pilus assembly secretin CpaC